MSAGFGFVGPNNNLMTESQSVIPAAVHAFLISASVILTFEPPELG